MDVTVRAIAHPRGFAAIGLHRVKNPLNAGSVLRAAQCFGVPMVAMTERFRKAPTDTMKAWAKMPVLQVDDLRAVTPYDAVPVAVDLVEGATPLPVYQHPVRAFYIFGPEDGTLSPRVLDWCRDRIAIPTNRCLNLAAAVNVVLYDRAAKIDKQQRRPT